MPGCLPAVPCIVCSNTLSNCPGKKKLSSDTFIKINVIMPVQYINLDDITFSVSEILHVACINWDLFVKR